MSSRAHGEAALRTPRLPRHTHGPQSVVWWGMVGLVTIEIVVFTGLIAIYFYLKLSNAAWPPEGIGDPPLLLPTINTVILILSGVAMAIADRSVRRGRYVPLVVGQGVALALGVTFLVIKAIEYTGYDYDWSTHAYGSTTWLMSGLHAAHVTSVILKGFVVFAMAVRGMFRPDRRLALQVNGLYWQFVVVIWIPLYVTMYITPRL